MSTGTTISFVRHGHVHNPQHVLYGRLPRFRLSDTGRAQAKATAQALRDKPISALYCSPMLRARQTAKEIQTAHPGLTVHISALLNEVHTAFEGKPMHALITSGWDLYTGSGYEQPQDVLERVVRFIRRTRKRHPSQHVVAVTHGDVIAFVIRWAKRLPAAPSHRDALLQVGVPGGYPAPASIVTLSLGAAGSDGGDDSRDVPMLSYHDPFQESAE